MPRSLAGSAPPIVIVIMGVVALGYSIYQIYKNKRDGAGATPTPVRRMHTPHEASARRRPTDSDDDDQDGDDDDDDQDDNPWRRQRRTRPARDYAAPAPYNANQWGDAPSGSSRPSSSSRPGPGVDMRERRPAQGTTSAGRGDMRHRRGENEARTEIFDPWRDSPPAAVYALGTPLAPTRPPPATSRARGDETPRMRAAALAPAPAPLTARTNNIVPVPSTVVPAAPQAPRSGPSPTVRAPPTQPRAHDGRGDRTPPARGRVLPAVQPEPAREETKTQAQAQALARAREQVQARAQAMQLAQARAQGQVQAEQLTQARAQAQTQTQTQARTHAHAPLLVPKPVSNSSQQLSSPETTLVPSSRADDHAVSALSGSLRSPPVPLGLLTPPSEHELRSPASHFSPTTEPTVLHPLHASQIHFAPRARFPPLAEPRLKAIHADYTQTRTEEPLAVLAPIAPSPAHDFAVLSPASQPLSPASEFDVLSPTSSFGVLSPPSEHELLSPPVEHIELTPRIDPSVLPPSDPVLIELASDGHHAQTALLSSEPVSTSVVPEGLLVSLTSASASLQGAPPGDTAVHSPRSEFDVLSPPGAHELLSPGSEFSVLSPGSELEMLSSGSESGMLSPGSELAMLSPGSDFSALSPHSSGADFVSFASTPASSSPSLDSLTLPGGEGEPYLSLSLMSFGSGAFVGRRSEDGSVVHVSDDEETDGEGSVGTGASWEELEDEV